MSLGQRRTVPVPTVADGRERRVFPTLGGRRGRAGLATVTVLVLTVSGAGVQSPSPGGQPTALLPIPVAITEGSGLTPRFSVDPFGPDSEQSVLVAPVEAPVSSNAVLPLLAATDPRVDLTGIPTRVLEAYRAAADRLAVEQPGCALPWSLLAGIGRVESGHGTFGGASAGVDGRITPEIIGVRLDGAGPVAEIRDTDGGAYDRDLLFDRAVGPMQFIPSTWARYGADADGDGRADPHDIDDVALGAGRYLCAAAGGSLSDPAANVRAVYAYNNSNDYVRLVLTLAAGYAGANPETLGVGLLPPPLPAGVEALLVPGAPPVAPEVVPLPAAPAPPPPGDAGAPTVASEPGAAPAEPAPAVPATTSPAPADPPPPAELTPSPTPEPTPTLTPSDAPPVVEPSPAPMDASPTPALSP